ncbi:hypothetical protein GCM10027569_12910 [Flindersiella endophytica]
MDIMPRAGMVSPPPATGGGGGETRPETGQLVDPPSMTFGFPFVPLRDGVDATTAVPYSLTTGVDDNVFPAAGTYPPFGLSGVSPWPHQEDC